MFRKHFKAYFWKYNVYFTIQYTLMYLFASMSALTFPIWKYWYFWYTFFYFRILVSNTYRNNFVVGMKANALIMYVTILAYTEASFKKKKKKRKRLFVRWNTWTLIHFIFIASSAVWVFCSQWISWDRISARFMWKLPSY